MSEMPECDCEVVDDPDMVCPKHQDLLFGYVRKLESQVKILREGLKKISKEMRGCYLNENMQFCTCIDKIHSLAKQALSEAEKAGE